MQFMEMTAAVLLYAFPVFEVHNRELCRKYQAQVLGPLRAISKLRTEAIAKLSLRMGYFLSSDGKLHDAEQFEQLATDIYIQEFGAEDSRTLNSMNNLAVTYGALGRTKDAVALQEKVLEARERILGGEHPHMLRSMNNLAVTY